MSGSEFASLLLFCAALSFTPGPNTTLSTAIAANRGLRSALRFCLAVPAGWALIMFATALGAGALVMSLPALRWTLKLAGVGYMLWLAWRLARTRALTQPDMGLVDITFLQGMLMQFLNIKAWMLALALSAGWVLNHTDGDPAASSAMRFASVLAVMLCFGFCSNFTYALAGSLLRDWLGIGNRLQWFNRLMATVLALTAAWMCAS